MRFTEQMVGQRGAVVQLVRDGVLSQVQAAAELGCSVRQVRRLEAAAGDVRALAYRRRHPAPNRLGEAPRAAVREVHAARPGWSAGAVWEELEAAGLEPLPSPRTASRWLGRWRVGRYGVPRVLSSDNGSIFRTTRYEGSRFSVYSPEVLAGQAPTQFARAVGERGAVLLTHAGGNARIPSCEPS